jgi:hypothetical protein
MSVVLYRKGSTHREKGILCEMGVFSEYSFMHLVESGEWVLDPEELVEKKPTPKGAIKVEANQPGESPIPEEGVEVAKESLNLNTDRPSEFSDEMVRAKAAESGIKNWKRKGIKRLRKELGYDDQS